MFSRLNGLHDYMRKLQDLLLQNNGDPYMSSRDQYGLL